MTWRTLAQLVRARSVRLAVAGAVLTCAATMLIPAPISATDRLPDVGRRPPAVAFAQTTSPAQAAAKEWTVEELLPAIKDLGAGRDWNQGRELFRKAACGVCHAFASESEGTGLAPDLTGAASTFTREFILQSILEPSATVNGRFTQTTFTLKNGDVVTGSVIDEADKTIILAPVMMNPQVTVQIPLADVKSEAPSAVSAMPAGLLSGFTQAQVIELMAFLDSGGDRRAPVYRQK